jgi:hypothetical protein
MFKRASKSGKEGGEEESRRVQGWSPSELDAKSTVVRICDSMLRRLDDSETGKPTTSKKSERP